MKVYEDYDLVESGALYDDDGNSVDFDENIVCENIAEYLKKANKYLVFACGCRWNGASGYKFAHDYFGTVSRSYDVSIYPKAYSKGKKTLVCREYSHDVPMGATTIIVALTDKEYERLNNSSFSAVEQFAMNMCSKA